MIRTKTNNEKEDTEGENRKWNKRTKRKEIQFNEAEYAVVEQKANAARLSVAAFIREAALGKELSAALTIEESERIKRTANISYKLQVNLNQIARLANIHGLPFVTDAIREYICRTNEYFKTGSWHEMDLSAYESEQKQRNNLRQKCMSFKKRTRNYRKRQPTITFILPRVNAFFASGTTVGFIPIIEAYTGILRLPIIRLIYFQLKSAGHTLIMRFQYGIYMCIGLTTRGNKVKSNYID